MKTQLFYLLQMVISSGLLYGYYHLFLRNKRFHQYNRYYLLATIMISILIPFLDIPVYFSEQDNQAIWMQTISEFSVQPVLITASQHETPSLFTGRNILLMLYFATALFIMVRFIIAIIRIRLLLRKYKVEKLDDIYFVNTDEQGTPFSFFSWMFWNKKITLQSDDGQQIFRHELFHIKQKHSIDIVFVELVTVIFWINPFFHLCKKELKAIHEFLADQFAIRENNQWNYAELLLMQLMGTPNLRLTHPFFHNQIKRRIAMITSSKKPKYQYFRKMLVLPLVALIATLFAFSYKQKQEDAQMKEQSPLSVEGVLLEKIAGSDSLPEKVMISDKGQRPSVGLYIISGKKYTPAEVKRIFDDKAKVEAEVIYIEPGNAEAIKKYGAAAKNGVIIFNSLDIKNKLDAVVEERPLSQPLYVIDGKIVENNAGNILNEITPDKIQHITVLKDKLAAAKYGEKGKDGVIEIMTKLKGSLVKEVVIEDGVKDTDELKEVVVVGYATGTRQSPKFPGGESEWRKFLERNLNPMVPVDKGAPDGTYTVMLQFTVDVDGTIGDLKTLSHHGFGMEEEVVRVFTSGPKWIPGSINGKVVKTQTRQPITFQVIEKEGVTKLDLKEVVVTGVKLQPDNTVANKINDFKPVLDMEKLSPIYPNPAGSSVTIPFNSAVAGDGEVLVQDASGKSHLRVKTNLVKGLNNLNINVSSLASGIYLISVLDANKQQARAYKMVKK